MNKDERAQKKADNALKALEGVRRIGAPPFFYTRVQSHLQTTRQHYGPVGSRVLVAVVGVVALVILNLFTILHVASDDDSSMYGKRNLESFADEYSLSYVLY